MAVCFVQPHFLSLDIKHNYSFTEKTKILTSRKKFLDVRKFLNGRQEICKTPLQFNMKPATPKQTERLYAFMRQHYVEYFDVQTKLVERLENVIKA